MVKKLSKLKSCKLADTNHPFLADWQNLNYLRNSIINSRNYYGKVYTDIMDFSYSRVRYSFRKLKDGGMNYRLLQTRFQATNIYNSPVNYGYQIHASQELIWITYRKPQHTLLLTLNWNLSGTTRRNCNFKSIRKRIKFSNISIKVSHIQMKVSGKYQVGSLTILQNLLQGQRKISNKGEWVIPSKLQYFYQIWFSSKNISKFQRNLEEHGCFRIDKLPEAGKLFDLRHNMYF